MDLNQYFQQKETQEKINNIISKFGLLEKKDDFLRITNLVKDGLIITSDIPTYLELKFKISAEKAIDIERELFEKIWLPIYDELQQLYDENSKKQIIENENNKPTGEEVASDLESQTGLVQKYNNFIMSSLFQNILVSQEMMNEKFASAQTMQNEFYTAINAGDKIRAVAVLRILCVKGKLGSSFLNDKRYLDFWAGFLERHYGIDIKEKFLQNPVDKKYFIEFLRFILEKRLNFNIEDSAMIGTGLASLCAESGENEFSEMAYGDEEKGKFEWSE